MTLRSIRFAALRLAHAVLASAATSTHIYSSGHPAPGSGLKNPFGLIWSSVFVSKDAARAWTQITDRGSGK